MIKTLCHEVADGFLFAVFSQQIKSYVFLSVLCVFAVNTVFLLFLI